MAIQWSDDVMGKGGSSKPGGDIEFPKISRALLDNYYDELLWRPAFERLLDAMIEGGESPWLTGLRTTPPESFTKAHRSRLQRLYSKLSKGVHHEVIVPLVPSTDPLTTTQDLNEVLRNVGALGLVSSFVPHASAPQPADRALALFADLQDNEQV